MKNKGLRNKTTATKSTKIIQHLDMWRLEQQKQHNPKQQHVVATV